MQRFYINKNLEDSEIFEGERHHQITRVLRMQPGDTIQIFNETEEYIYKFISANKKSVEFARISENIFENTEPDLDITLFQALPNKIEKIEWILEKNIEIGVKKFVFFRSDRSQKLIVSESKKERFYTIAREAVEQCGGNYIPEIIFSDENLETNIKRNPKNNIALHTMGENKYFSDINNDKELHIWIGPEGGWSGSELEKMNNYWFIFAHFWKRVLRTETAGMVTIFGLLHTKH